MVAAVAAWTSAVVILAGADAFVALFFFRSLRLGLSLLHLFLPVSVLRLCQSCSAGSPPLTLATCCAEWYVFNPSLETTQSLTHLCLGSRTSIALISENIYRSDG